MLSLAKFVGVFVAELEDKSDHSLMALMTKSFSQIGRGTKEIYSKNRKKNGFKV